LELEEFEQQTDERARPEVSGKSGSEIVEVEDGLIDDGFCGQSEAGLLPVLRFVYPGP